VTEELAQAVGLDKNRGAMIASIDPGGPAAQAKLLPGDVILAYDGKPIENNRQLPRLVAATAPDKSVKVTLWRDRKEQQVDLKVAALDPNRPPPPPPPPEKPKPTPIVNALGVKVARVDPELRKRFSLPDWARGVVIMEVPDGTPAAAQGLHPGDLVMAVGRDPIATPEELQQKITAARKAGHKLLLVRVERDGSARFVALPAETG
jgi:serine protease Do